FIATFAVATAWGVLRYRPEWFASTEPFLLVNFALYLAIPWLYLRRAIRPDKLVMDGCLLFGNPLACLLLQGSLLDWRDTPMALSTLGAALLYAAIAWNVRRQSRLNILHDAWLVLAGVFATLTIPLAFGAGVTACLFAVEGAGLVWLGLRQKRWFAHVCGLTLQVLAALGLLDSCAASATGDLVPVFNRCFMGAMVITASGLVICRLYHRHKEALNVARAGSLLALAWVLAWWLGATITETLRVLDGPRALAGCWMVLTVTMWLAAEAAARLRTQALGTTTAWVGGGLSALLLLPILLCLAFDWQPLRGWLLVACAVMAVTGWRALMQLKAHALTAMLSQFIWWWRWAMVAGVAVFIAMQSAHSLSDAWRLLAVCVPGLALWFVTLWSPRWLAPPLRATFARTRSWLLRSLSLLFAGVFVIGLFLPGDAAPLVFVPLLNPLEALLLLCLTGLLGWSRHDAAVARWQQLRPLMLAVAGLLAVTSFALRGVHQWAGVPWDAHLAHSALAQLALTLVWSLAGLLAWLRGSRRGERLLWMAGAVLMAVVLLKLLLIDRGHLGNLFGIGSFIAYGVLCTIIGYIAPAPPRQAAADRDTPSKEAS
ncbi:MAG TPA: DUF2339 domain-containing protein, partial [Oleiagrimonas sp.]|nr:DUF2339 domain-containing protein [Oleiagrimonas sp.]